MTLASASIAESPILTDGAGAVSSSSVGVMAPLSAYGTQGSHEFQGESFRATETQWSFRARSDRMLLGVTDKNAGDRVWYEGEFIDILRGASIVSFNPAFLDEFGNVIVGGYPGLSTLVAQELVSNGQTVHKVRVLIGSGAAGNTDSFLFRLTCSDGSYITRRLKIRIKTP